MVLTCNYVFPGGTLRQSVVSAILCKTSNTLHKHTIVFVVGYNACKSSPCSNGATCNANARGYDCTCNGNYEGTNCVGECFVKKQALREVVVMVCFMHRYCLKHSTVASWLCQLHRLLQLMQLTPTHYKGYLPGECSKIHI